MSAEPWIDPKVMGWAGGIAGSLIGVWGAVFGSACSYLVPRGRGKRALVGALGVSGGLGVCLLLVGLVALVGAQPFAIWSPFLLCGVLLAGLSIPFVFVLRLRYRETELRKMRADELT